VKHVVGKILCYTESLNSKNIPDKAIDSAGIIKVNGTNTLQQLIKPKLTSNTQE
jgi:hypothetical protein